MPVPSAAVENSRRYAVKVSRRRGRRSLRPCPAVRRFRRFFGSSLGSTTPPPSLDGQRATRKGTLRRRLLSQKDSLTLTSQTLIMARGERLTFVC